jgi:cation diffusion facilitator family transporter
MEIEETNMNQNFQRVANRVSAVSIGMNIVLSVFKLIAGLVAHSNAMISDAIHSASDVFSTIVVVIGIRLAAKESDKDHPYGHERLECVAAIVLAGILCATGCWIGIQAFSNIISGNYEELVVPGVLAMVAAVISILTKEGMFWYTKENAKRINSGALMADAWHHRSDALSSVGALIGIAGARMGLPIMDSIASLVIFFFIVKASYDIFMDAVDKMVDHCCDAQTEAAIYERIIMQEDVLEVNLLQTRIFGNKIYVDIEIGVDGSYSLWKAHSIAEAVHDDIEAHFPQVKHIMVHENPMSSSEGNGK